MIQKLRIVSPIGVVDVFAYH